MSILIQRNIAGLHVTIEGPNSLELKQLDQELSIYHLSQSEPDIHIQYGPSPEHVLTQNPSIHFELKNGFAVNFGQDIISWHWNKSMVGIKWKRLVPAKNWRSKIRGMQFTHPFESIGQSFFELIFIPTLQLFYYDRFLILHGSALSDQKDGRSVVFGGTGGVGKTSISLSLIGSGYDFMADDITIIDKSGVVYANYAWPKIYGYNAESDFQLKKRVLKNRNFLDRIQWDLRLSFFGGNKVRRRVDPKIFFNSSIKNKAKIKIYYILFKDKCNSIFAEILPPQKSIAMSLNIIDSEYTILYRHLYWHNFNSIALSRTPFITKKAIFSNWHTLGQSLLSEIPTFLIHIPLGMPALEMRDQLEYFVSEFTPDTYND